MTNVCRNDCYYCASRCSARIRRTSFSPEELARAFVEMHEAGLVSGLFLSSGIAGEPDEVQQKIVDTATIVRERYGFRGYVHLKIIPGASPAAVEETVRVASRVSVNLEAPSAEHLRRIAPDKDFRSSLLETLRITAQTAARLSPRTSVTTQFVAGAAGESDAELLSAAWHLYQRLGLRRAYYSGFRPVPGTPLSDEPAFPPIRQHRLYQADWLMRFYRFRPDELIYDENGRLPETTDPKLAWASRHPELFPVEVNTASYMELLRVPGIGPTTARRIIEARKAARLRDLRDLSALGAAAARAASFVTIGGRRPRSDQLRLPLPEEG
ncbi:MAG: helix-hairpin-helix domain-containing protein [Armatimonadetes bacterium]|nr:helix-hairpin-helix domain-containing protein [Armatimonadota bacterium]